MKIKINSSLAIILFLAISLSACEDFLEEQPESFIAPENLYTSASGAILGVNGIYDILNFIGASRREHYLLTEIASDDAQYTAGNASRVELSNLVLEAQQRLEGWVQKVNWTQNPAWNKFLKTLTNWKDPILNFIESGISNAVTEGCNNLVRYIRRISFGIPNFEHMRLRVLVNST